MTRITTRQFVELIQGKNLSTAEISALTHEKHPGNSMTRSQICIRLKSMLRSPNVNMIRTGQKTRPDKTLWHFNPKELQACSFHKMFDQALADVEGGLVGLQYL